MIFDSDDEVEKESERGEGGEVDRAEGEGGRDIAVSEDVKEGGKEEQKTEGDTQNGGERMENGNKESETENDVKGI